MYLFHESKLLEMIEWIHQSSRVAGEDEHIGSMKSEITIRFLYELGSIAESLSRGERPEHVDDDRSKSGFDSNHTAFLQIVKNVQQFVFDKLRHLSAPKTDVFEVPHKPATKFLPTRAVVHCDACGFYI